VPTMNMMDADDTSTRRYGKYRAEVADNTNPDQGDDRGRIKVRVHGLSEETPDGQSDQPMEVLADPLFTCGCFFPPKVGDLVWVEFVAGDINQAIWTGCWYADASPTPKATDAGKPNDPGAAPTIDQKIIRTKSGQVIQLDDTSGSEQLVVKDEKNGNTVTLNKDGIKIEATASGKSVTLTFGQTTVVVKDDSITLTSAQVNILSQNGQVQELATKAFVQDLYDTHTHPSGVGPTDKPVVPSKSNPLALTSILKAQ
jgi:uncharacterized protein involved in type VI secretion and phage assembly